MADIAQEPKTSPPKPSPPKPSSGRAWDRERLVDLGLEALSVSMLAFIAAGLVVWSDRREIGRDLAQAWLKDHGIEAAVPS